MIIAACTDDPTVQRIAQNATQSDPGVFGNWYKVFAGNIPDLGANEDLFIVAHGAAIGDEGQPVIGSQSNHFYLTARDLNANLHVFPIGYSGSVYVYACQSALNGKAEVSFVDQFHSLIDQSFPGVEVYGQTGSPGGPLPGPHSASWTPAT